MNFLLYFKLGVDHISDLNGYDHILFIIAMCAGYALRQWKKVAILVTAFTVGHSISLALAVLNIVPVYSALIEFLIPVTIVATCLRNVLFPPTQNNIVGSIGSIPKTAYWQYFWILAFGIIHGLGFSNFIKATLAQGESIFSPLLAFNLGLELGQLLIVLVVFIINFVFLGILKTQQRDWNLFVSGAVAGIAFILLLEKGYELFAG